jgi:hypothetical protein
VKSCCCLAAVRGPDDGVEGLAAEDDLNGLEEVVGYGGEHEPGGVNLLEGVAVELQHGASV